MASYLVFLEKKCPLVSAELNSSCSLSLFIKPVDGSKKFLQSSFTFWVILNVTPFSDTPIFNEYFSGKITNSNQQQKHLYGSFLLFYISTY